MMAGRGIALAHKTILRWVQRYVPELGFWEHSNEKSG
jgi:transposase-like protein